MVKALTPSRRNSSKGCGLGKQTIIHNFKWQIRGLNIEKINTFIKKHILLYLLGFCFFLRKLKLNGYWGENLEGLKRGKEYDQDIFKLKKN